MTLPLPDDMEIRFYPPGGIGRRAVGRNALGVPSYKTERYGGYGDLTLPTFVEYAQGDLLDIHLDDRVEVYYKGTLRYRGYVNSVQFEAKEPRTITVRALGGWALLRKQRCPRNYAFPQVGNGVDVSVAFAKLVRDVQKTTRSAGTPIISVIQALPINTTISSLVARNKLFGDVIDDIIKQSGNLSVLGCDVDAAGNDRAYIRPLSTGITHALAVPSPNVSVATSEQQLGDLINQLIVRGGAARYPDLLHNGSFELPVSLADGQGSIVENGSFEANAHPGASFWTMNAGASVELGKNSYPATANAFTGKAYLEVDHNGENAVQTANVVMVAGDTYMLSMYAAKEVDLQTATGHATLVLYSGANQTGTVLATITLGLTPVSQTWDYFAATFAAPAGAQSYKLTITADSIIAASGQQGGLVVDEVELFDTSIVYQDGWIAQDQGTTAIINAVNWIYDAEVYDGAYCLYLDGTAMDADGHDLQIRPPDGARMKVYGGQTLRFSAWMKSPASSTNPFPKLIMEFDWFNASGGYISRHQVTVEAGGNTLAAWTYHEVIQAAPSNAVACNVTCTLRSSGALLLDALSVMDAAAPTSQNGYYQPDGPCEWFIKASDAALTGVGGAYPGASYANSETLLGQSCGDFQDNNIITLTDALAVANNKFFGQGFVDVRPTVTVTNDLTAYWPGDTLGLVDTDGALLSPAALPIAQIKETYDGVLKTTISTQREAPDESLVIKRIVNNQIRQYGTGNGYSASGYSSGSNSQNGGQATATVPVTDEFTGDGVTTTFVLSKTPVGAISVFVEGVRQRSTTGGGSLGWATGVSGASTTVVIGTAPASGADVVIDYDAAATGPV